VQHAATFRTEYLLLRNAMRQCMHPDIADGHAWNCIFAAVAAQVEGLRHLRIVLSYQQSPPTAS
jgi:hypothetical protein